MQYIQVWKTLRSNGKFHWLVKLVGGVYTFGSLDEDEVILTETYKIEWYGLVVLHIFEYLCGYLPAKVCENSEELIYINYKKLLYPLNLLIILLTLT